MATQSSGKPAEDFFAELAKANMIEARDIPRIEAVSASLKSESAALEMQIDQARLATRIFPAYVRALTTVDVRLESDEKRLAVVVALIHIGTDDRDVAIQFQITRPQLENLIEQLQELRREMEDAARVVSFWEGK